MVIEMRHNGNGSWHAYCEEMRAYATDYPSCVDAYNAMLSLLGSTKGVVDLRYGEQSNDH